MDNLICNACRIPIHSDEERAAHYKSEWHRYNVKRRCAGLASIPQQLFDSQLAALNQKKAAESAQKAEQNCRTCKKAFATASAYQAHIASKKHLKKVEKQGEGGADEEDEEEEEAKVAPVSAVKSASAQPAESKEAEADADAMVEDGEEGEDEEEEGEAIPLLHCLFCSKKFDDIQTSVDHMLKQHGFFIPFIENLVDLDGLLTYLGEKIGIGHVCLWCNGAGRARYPSTESVQMHMKAKSHCKLRLEDDDDEEELLDYYDFDLEPEEDEAMDGTASSSSALVVAAPKAPPRQGGGGASSINEAGELVLANGSIVGSRAHKVLYKQHVLPSRDLVAIAAHYKQLALNTNVKQENPRIYRRKREAFHLRARKREDLMKGLAANFQFHFRAQVSY